MGSSSDGSDTLTGAEDPTEGNQRGFLSRLFNALSPSDTSPDDAGTSPGPIAPTAPNLHGIGNLRRLRVDDVVIPKVEITAVPESIGLDELVAVFKEHGYSRLPVYAEDMDHPLGQVLLKDIALQFGFGAGGGDFSLTPLIRPVLYTAPSMPLGVLLQKMQKERVHMALVIDEYGGVDGLVTIEDLIETVIGEIDDEHDDEDAKLWVLEKPGVYLAQARAPLDEFEHAVGLKLRTDEDDEDIDTLGGLVFLRSGRVPAPGEVVPHESGAEFEIVDADPRTIKRLRLRMPDAASGPSLLPPRGPEA
ncbi:MAG: magnesium/cobalt efflux protein [Cereibacter sphaeroides]|uniref:Magnesium/cobalt efflux protein n=1 Tax=Cereibacter sphaeroides TaxID=1063 RepID=A0A2W5SII2_CERSP|nr:MAG: magnesium/cobalt efflux protein [Cereibacter sphaeroides]